jgi:hypothetical protein
MHCIPSGFADRDTWRISSVCGHAAEEVLVGKFAHFNASFAFAGTLTSTLAVQSTKLLLTKY